VESVRDSKDAGIVENTSRFSGIVSDNGFPDGSSKPSFVPWVEVVIEDVKSLALHFVDEEPFVGHDASLLLDSAISHGDGVGDEFVALTEVANVFDFSDEPWFFDVAGFSESSSRCSDPLADAIVELIPQLCAKLLKLSNS
jgi:hypothetical protein